VERVGKLRSEEAGFAGSSELSGSETNNTVFRWGAGAKPLAESGAILSEELEILRSQ
jgi:hypothetical protein